MNNGLGHMNKSRIRLLILLPIICIGVFAILSISQQANLPSNISGEQITNGSQIPVDPEIATTSTSSYYYDDTTAEGSYSVFNNSVSDNEFLAVTYSIDATQHLVTGIRYYHWDSSMAGPFTVEYRVGGDSGTVIYTDTNIPATTGSWRTYKFLGGRYATDDDPEVLFYSQNPSTNCMGLGYDTKTVAGHSWYSVDGGAWTSQTGQEYMVDLIYEDIPMIASFGSYQSGGIDSTDYVDAYGVTIPAGRTYQFILTRPVGTVPLNMRLVPYTAHNYTGSVVNSTTGAFPQDLRYKSGPSDTTYLILVESASTSQAGAYNLVAYDITPDDDYEPNDLSSEAKQIISGTYNLVAQDDDWFYLYVPQGSIISAYISFNNVGNDLDLYLYNSALIQVNSSASSSNNWELASYHVTTSGNYYIRERLYSGFSNYNLIVNITNFDDIYEDNDVQGQAALITTGTRFNLVFADDDWYYINVPAHYTIIANISFNPATNLDLLLRSSTTNLSQSNSLLGWELVSFAVTVTDNYYIRINITSGTWTYYDMTVTIIPTEDAFEPNDVAASATTLTNYGTYNWLAALDEDWYRISVPEDYTLVVDISFINAIGDLDLYLYNSYNFVTPINSSTSGFNNWERVSYRTFSTDFYYIRVVLSSGTPTHYDLTLSTRVDVYDADEPNNNFAQAHRVYSSDYPETSLVIQDIADYYYFSVEAGSYITVNISFYHIIADLDLYLYNPAQTQVNSSTSAINDWERVTYQAGVTGNYYIRVYRYGGNQALYDLSVKVTAPDDGYEENDVKAQATPIGIGTYFSLVCADDDYYYLYIPAGYTFIANITFNHLVTSLDLTITNATSEFPWLNWTYTFDDTNRISYTVSEAGFYYLKVSGFGSPVHYSMTIFVTIQDDAYEDNDVRAQARAISTGEHNWLVAEDDDWYSLNVDAGSEVHVYLWFNNSIGNLDLFLYNPAGSQVNWSTSTIFNFEYVFYNVTAAGNYYIRTTLTSGLPTFYNLTIITISWDDFYEPNDVQSQSTVVSFGSLSFLRCVDDDWFNMTAPAGILLKVNITFDHLVGNLNLYLYNASGIQLNQSISASNDWEEVTFAIRVSACFFIRVVWASGSWAEYNLTVWPVLPNGDDVFETNNIKADAAEVLINSTYETLICANDDWYKIFVEAGNTVSCSIYFDNSFGDLDLKIFDSSGALLGLSQGNYDFEVVAANVTHSAYYFIQVYKFNPVGLNTYQMLLMTMELPQDAMDDTYEENDVQLQAAEIVPGTITGLVCADDDWFKVYVTAGNKLSVSISFTNSLGNLDLGFFNAVKHLISSTSTISNGESLTFDITTTGYYYIRVNRTTTTNEYSLTITPSTIVDTPLPPPPAEIPGYDLFIMASACFIAIALIAVKKINRRRN